MFLVGEQIEAIQHALKDLRRGKFVLVYDDDNREGETDLVLPAEFVTPDSIRTMRKDGGGLVFLMVSHDIAQQLQLPYLSDLYASVHETFPVLQELIANDIPYDTKSSFSLYINHRKTFTGITDKDRSLTMRSFATLIHNIQDLDSSSALHLFGKEFRSPGHVPICVASQHPLRERFGHTELVVALLTMAGLIPVGSGCEMMGDMATALSKTKAKDYARDNNLVFIEGKDIVKAWKQWSK
jgi:3,4-dihydroxy 2-butanone 4-phosphate synthase